MNKKATMTDAERIWALLDRKVPDRVPLWPFAAAGFSCVNTRCTIADAYNNAKKSLEAQRKTAEEFGWVYVPFMGYAAYGGWEFGGEIKWPSGEFSQAPTVLKPPVETEEDVWNLKTPDVATAGIIPFVKEFYDLSRNENLPNKPFNVVANCFGPFTLAANIAEPAKLSKWMIKKPDVAHRLLELATQHSIDCAEYWKGLYGTEGVLVFSGEATTSNQVISPKQFEAFAMPYLKQMHEAILAMGYKHIYCHICGEQNANMPGWTNVPMGDPGIISIGHEVAIEDAARFFPNDIILGQMEPALIQALTPDGVYEATRKVVEAGKKLGGRYIFSPGCEWPPMAPRENVMAVTRAVEDYGWY